MPQYSSKDINKILQKNNLTPVMLNFSLNIFTWDLFPCTVWIYLWLYYYIKRYNFYISYRVLLKRSKSKANHASMVRYELTDWLVFQQHRVWGVIWELDEADGGQTKMKKRKEIRRKSWKYLLIPSLIFSLSLLKTDCSIAK